MKTYQFTCKLLSDIVLTSSTATESQSKSLDYIPGAKFLGIASKSLYLTEDEISTLDIFHNGKVRFSDALPKYQGSHYFPMPFNWFYPKGKDLSNGIYLHHKLDAAKRENLIKTGIQLKQARENFINPKSKQIFSIEQGYRLKTAFDKEKRKSADGKMFGYFSLPANSEWVFTVSDDTDQYLQGIKTALEGKKTIGRSKSSEYGLVDIKFEKEIIESQTHVTSGQEILIYAQSNLCFVNGFGETTAEPSAEQLTGLVDAEIVWENSQIRSRKYQNWNGHRNNKDVDRIILMKGSVFAVRTAKPIENAFFERGIGSFKSEGFGQVLINPSFLQSNTEMIQGGYEKIERENSPVYHQGLHVKTDQIIAALERRSRSFSFEKEVNKMVDEFKQKNASVFNSISNSQWGTLRVYSKQCSNYEAFYNLVFGKKDKDGKMDGFIYKGQSEKQWRDNAAILQDFISKQKGGRGADFALSFVKKLSQLMTK